MRARHLVGGLVAVGVLGIGGVALATIPGSGGVIHACYSASGADATNGTQLNIINSDKASCNGKGQREITWGQQGPPGLKGDPGQKGDPGEKGDTGASGVSNGYAASNTHVIDADAPDTQELVGVSGLPAGNYFVSATIFAHLGGDLFCDLTQGTTPIQPAGPIHYQMGGDGDNMTMTSYVTDAGANTSFYVRCGHSGDAPTAFAKIVAIKIDTIQ